MKDKYKFIYIITSMAIALLFTSIFINSAAKKNTHVDKQDTTPTSINESSSEVINEPSSQISKEESSSSSSISNDNNSSNNNSINSSNVSKSNSVDNQTQNYQELFPDLYVTPPSEFITKGKTAYLTFDDGPSDLTEKILDILKKENIKATFFVIGNESEKGKQMMKRIVNEGHSIGIHTFSHDYKKIYSSIEIYLEDFNQISNLIYETTGVKPDIFRFPGGSKNGFNKSIYNELCNEMIRRGFTYYDWNNSCGDCSSNYSVANCIKNVLNNSSACNRIISLMHDAPAKKYTVEALPKIIQGLKDQGFSFDKITNNVQPITF